MSTIKTFPFNRLIQPLTVFPSETQAPIIPSNISSDSHVPSGTRSAKYYNKFIPQEPFINTEIVYLPLSYEPDTQLVDWYSETGWNGEQGSISLTEFQALPFDSVYGIWINDEVNPITSVSNLHSYKNLYGLDFDYQKLTSLDLTGCGSVQSFYFTFNAADVISLDMRPLVNLTEAYLYYNAYLGSFNISNCTLLTELQCEQSYVNSLDITHNILLERLNCCYNKIETLNVSNNTVLRNLYANGNILTQSSVDQILIDLDVNGVVSGTVLLNEVGNEMRTSASDDAYNSLLNKGWVIFSNDGYDLLNWWSGPNYDGDYHPNVSFNDFFSVTKSTVGTISFITWINPRTPVLSLISDLTSYTNLKLLEMANQPYLKSLDVSSMNLDYLYVNDNYLSALNTKNNANLQDIACYNNNLSTLNIDDNVSLSWLGCWNNKLTTLDLTNNTELLYCYAGNNRLTESSVNQILTNLDNHGRSSGDIDLSDGTNAAPSGAALTAIDSLLNKYWNVYYNS